MRAARPQHHLLKSEGGCEAMAEGESIMASLHPGEPAVHTALVFIFLFSPPSERKAAKDWGGGRQEEEEE